MDSVNRTNQKRKPEDELSVISQNNKKLHNDSEFSQSDFNADSTHLDESFIVDKVINDPDSAEDNLTEEIDNSLFNTIVEACIDVEQTDSPQDEQILHLKAKLRTREEEIKELRMKNHNLTNEIKKLKDKTALIESKLDRFKGVIIKKTE